MINDKDDATTIPSLLGTIAINGEITKCAVRLIHIVGPMNVGNQFLQIKGYSK